MLILSCGDTSLTVIILVARKIIDIIHIIVPILLILMVSISLFKLITDPNAKDGHKKLFNQIIAAVIIFFIPTFLDVTLGLLSDKTNFISCWNEVRVSANIKPESTYVSPNNSKKSLQIVNNPNDYEIGDKKTTDSSTTKSTTTTSSTNKSGLSGSEIVAYAEQFNGKPYKAGGHWNGEFPYTATDCVGFVKGVYKHFGISIPTNASKLFTTPSKFTVVTGQPLQAGDIVVYNHHRALATGEGNRLIHAMGVKYGIGHSKNYKNCGAGPVRGVVRVNALSE